MAADAKILTVPGNSTGVVIQSALDQLPEGGEVLLAPGTFEVREPIVLRRDHQTLRGSGFKTVLLLADGANCPVVILGSPVKPRREATLGAPSSLPRLGQAGMEELTESEGRQSLLTLRDRAGRYER